MRLSSPALGAEEISAVLSSLSLDAPRTLMVHSSLSACGHFRRGCLEVIDALRDWNAGGTLAMPAHSYCYPDAEGRAPVFDPRRSLSRVGAITDCFWRQPGVLRSLHPTHSLACEGPHAAHLVAGHERCQTPCGAGTPYEKMIKEDAAVLMWGVTLDAFTFLHTAEEAAMVPYLYEPGLVPLKMLSPDGAVIDFPMRRQDMKVSRRFAALDVWLEERGLLQRRRLGRGELLFMPHSLQVHEAVVSELRRDPWFLTTRMTATPGNVRC